MTDITIEGNKITFNVTMSYSNGTTYNIYYSIYKPTAWHHISRAMSEREASIFQVYIDTEPIDPYSDVERVIKTAEQLKLTIYAIQQVYN